MRFSLASINLGVPHGDDLSGCTRSTPLDLKAKTSLPSSSSRQQKARTLLIDDREILEG
jgi:hypothetical protein